MNTLQPFISLFAKEERTPFYFYDLAVLTNTIDQMQAASPAGAHIHYALKSNANDQILKIIRDKKLGADCVSGNEVRKAKEAGFESSKIVFAGVGKSDTEINLALDANIFCFNCESMQELEVIDGFAKSKNKHASIALRINPNVNANTHHYITTGLEENKFGINLWELDQVLEKLKGFKNLKLAGLHFHIGSQVTELSAFRSLCLKVNEIQKIFESKRIPLQHINVGGGLGIDYHEPDKNPIPDFKSFFRIFSEMLELRPGQQLHFELGRSIVGACGTLITKVLYIKKGINTNFIILDAGMTELIRPALYQSFHTIQNLSAIFTELKNKAETKSRDQNIRYDVVGPICESSDCFAKSLLLPESFRGDLFAIRSTGAYGEVMSSAYNLRDKANVIVSG